MTVNVQSTPSVRLEHHHRGGDRINAVLASAGYNFSLLLRWLERLLRTLIRALLTALSCTQTAYRMLPNGSSRTTKCS